jgi:hypothetical protein
VTNPDAQSDTLDHGFGITVSDSLPLVGATIRSLLDAVASPASLTRRFCIWGEVELIDSSSFRLDDGSGTRIKVFAPGYSGIASGDFVSAIGGVDVSSSPPVLVSSADRVRKY